MKSMSNNAPTEQGPYFLGDQICLVDVHLAPFALRLSRLKPFRDLPLPTPPSRWKEWVDALEHNPHVRGTTSTPALYTQSMEDLVLGFQGIVD
jgi:glutathione S-transferase